MAGVLAALALNAWAGERQNESLELTYLQQLRADLLQTVRAVDAADEAMDAADRSGALALRAFQTLAPPPADSLLTWIRAASRYRYPIAVFGTAEALVFTGDLTLIDDPALRAAIVEHLGQARVLNSDFRKDVDLWEAARDRLFLRIDYQQVLATALTPATLDSLGSANPFYPVPPGERMVPFPTPVGTLLRDREVYSALERMNSIKAEMRWDRSTLRAESVALLDRVEAALEV